MCALQEKHLQRQLAHLHKASPFYQKKFQTAGIEPEAVRTLKDLRDLPFTTKQELRESQEESPPFGTHLGAPIEDVVLTQTTSGTSGRPVFQAFTKADLASRYEVYSRVFRAWGLARHDRVVHAMALSMFGGGIAVCNSVMHFGAVSVPVGAEANSSQRLLNLLRDMRATAMLITPSYAEYLGKRCKEHLGIDASELGLRIIGCFAEPGGEDPVIRGRLEKLWGATVYDGGGSSDAAPILFANCKERQGKHFFAPDFGIVELIDCDTGAPLELEDGVEGEWVFTHLRREASPLVRFRAGDRIRVFTSPCRCGRTSFRMLYLGRIDEMLIVRGVNLFPTAIKSVIEEFFPRTTGEVRILLSKPGPRVDLLRVRVEHGAGETVESAARLTGQIEQAIKTQLRVRATVEMVPPGTIPRPEVGKAKLVEMVSV
jgi:phenylacetate-CoA ligase